MLVLKRSSVSRVFASFSLATPGASVHIHRCGMFVVAGTCCAGSWHATQKPAGREESQRVNERVTAWNNMSREEKEGKNPLNSLFNGITTKVRLYVPL